MPARELNSLAEVINAALVAGRRTAMGIAVALANAGRVVPEGGAAELSRLQALMNAQPADLTPEQVEALEAAGDRVVNDWNHDDQCACAAWPEKCLSSGGYFDGTWDVGGLALALPAVIGLWEVLRSADTVGEVAVLNAALAESRERADAQATEIDRLAGLLREAVAGAVVADELYTAWLQRAEAAEIRNAELEALVLAAGAAAEQRHQLLDPSEPPLGCFMTGPICALALADALAVDVPPAVTA